jgi:putative FmdB family regulatory protein
MPIYEYICNKCKAAWEEIRPLKDSDKGFPCLACTSEDTRKVFSRPGLVKGPTVTN